MIRSKEVQQVLHLIDNEPKLSVTRENVFDNPVRIYLVIKSLYQNYKRKNVLELMQERIFDIRLPSAAVDRNKLSNVTAANIFQYHQLSQDDLLLLIQMKEYLKEDTKVELYGEIFKGIDLLGQVKEVMNCYRALLNLEYYNKKRDMYACIEEKMIAKLIGMELTDRDLKVIARNLLALPVIKQPILILISRLYQKTNELKYFKDLFTIFSNNFPINPNQADLEALIRINLDETLAVLLKIVQNKEEHYQLALQIAQSQAKRKLQTMPLVMTSKTKAVLNFIIQVVKFGRPIWHEIIQWQHKAAQQPKNFLKQNLENILVGMLKDSRHFQTILSIIQKITEIDQHSQIGLIFVRQLLKLQNREYLSHRIIRRFLAIKILKYNTSQEYVSQIFGKGTKFIDIILEMFNFQLALVVNFYLNLIRSEESNKLLEEYVKELAVKMPTKFKEFYLKWNAIDKVEAMPGNILTGVTGALFKMLADNVSVEVAVNMTRDLALLVPSRHILNIFTKFLSNFPTSKPLKTQVARTLNLILIRTLKEQINNTIKFTLPGLIRQHLMTQSAIIFENVPQETKDYLKKSYDDYLARRTS